MNIRFIAPNPRQKARPLLDDVLLRGTDQIAIACAFLTGGGVEALRRHAVRLRLPNSFVVVAWDEPTQLEAVEALHNLCPGNVYVHLGDETPREIRVGRGLMHSKVFLAREGQNCWLWTGSHNLTASATQGVNCEAALMVDGEAHEQPFQDALAHLNQCKDEAILFDPFHPPLPPKPHDTLVIHAERDTSFAPLPWFVHLRPSTTIYDQLVKLELPVWLYVHPPGTLRPGVQPPRAKEAYSGTITAVNFTEFHPRTKGIPAEWSSADYVIEELGRVFHLVPPTTHRDAPTQIVFRIDEQADPDAIWVSEVPLPRQERIAGNPWDSELDEGFEQFFTRASLGQRGLIHRPFRELDRSLRLSRQEVAELGEHELQRRFEIPVGTRLFFDEVPSLEASTFIYRAKYRR